MDRIATLLVLLVGWLPTIYAECTESTIELNETKSGNLGEGDCRVSDLLSGNSDSSLLDVYRLELPETIEVTATLNSTSFDAFLRVTDANNTILAEDDDGGDGFNSAITLQLEAGTYKFLANSATSAADTGSYELLVAGELSNPGSSRLINIATRAEIGTGDNVLIGGLVIGGGAAKTVLVRAIGPALADAGVGGALLDPSIRLFRGSEAIDFNDDWPDHSRASEIPLSLQPRFQLESAILATLDPGAYTAILTGVNDSTGIGLVEIYEVNSNDETKLLNISTRGRVGTGDAVMIGGLVIAGNVPKKVMIRAIGPSLADAGVSNTLSDPYLRLFNSSGQVIDENNNWQDHNNSSNIPESYRPKNSNEAAIYTTLSPGPYTAIVSGVGDAAGIAIVEVYEL